MPLDRDRITALEARSELPEGNPASIGAPVVYDGLDDDGDDSFILGSNPDPQVREGNGDPNGNVNAPKGTLYVERDVPALWQNTDGVSAWANITGSGTSGDIWSYLPSAPAEVLINTTTAPNLEDFYVNLDPGSSPHGHFEIFDDGTGPSSGAGNAFLEIYSGGDIFATANGELEIASTIPSGLNNSDINIASGSVSTDLSMQANGTTNAAVGAFAATSTVGFSQVTVTGGNAEGEVLLDVSDGTNAAYIYLDSGQSGAATRIRLNGVEVIIQGCTAAPNSGDLNNGDFGLWLDTSTSQLKVRGKIAGTAKNLTIGTLT